MNLGELIGTILGTAIIIVAIAGKIIKDAVGNQVGKEISREFKKALDDEPGDVENPERVPGLRPLVMELVKSQGALNAQVAALATTTTNEVEVRKDWQRETRERFDRITADNTKRFDTVDKCVKEMTAKVNQHDTEIARLQERQRIRAGNGPED